MTVNGNDYEVTSTITYGDVVTPVEEFANEVLDYLSTPTGQATMASIAVATMVSQPEIAPVIFEAIEASGIYFETAATGAAATALEATTATPEEEESVFASAVARGRQFEADAMDALGLTKNTDKFDAAITMADGTTQNINVIPDAVTSERFVELKDQAYLAYSQQLRGEVSAATTSGKPMDLILGPSAR